MSNEIIKLTNYLQKNQTKSLLGKLKNSGKCILIDISGSMSDYTLQGKTKYQILQDTLQNGLVTAALYEFSNECKKVSGSISTPKGNTMMSNAFNTVKDARFTEAVLLTDGAPTDDEVSVIRASLNLKLHIIYIGDEPIPEFLRKLGSISGNSFGNVNLNLLGGQLELQNRIKGLIG